MATTSQYSRKKTLGWWILCVSLPQSSFVSLTGKSKKKMRRGEHCSLERSTNSIIEIRVFDTGDIQTQIYSRVVALFYLAPMWNEYAIVEETIFEACNRHVAFSLWNDQWRSGMELLEDVFESEKNRFVRWRVLRKKCTKMHAPAVPATTNWAEECAIHLDITERNIGGWYGTAQPRLLSRYLDNEKLSRPMALLCIFSYKFLNVKATKTSQPYHNING